MHKKTAPDKEPMFIDNIIEFTGSPELEIQIEVVEMLRDDDEFFFKKNKPLGSFG